jgi:hypothetical protein
MFNYADPVGRGFLSNDAVAQVYRQRLQGVYDSFARRADSSFTWAEAFEQLAGGQLPTPVSVDWFAFPLTAQATANEIDRRRLDFQDEYVEWRTETKANKLARVTFTTEFPEYFEAFAAVGFDALAAAVRDAQPDANPTVVDLFGPGFNPDAAPVTARINRFRGRLPANPWNNGEKGILCLMQQFNTLSALFNLLTECGVARVEGTPQDTCGLVGGACGVGRSSDPAVCAQAQSAARGKLGFTLRDPGGVRIVELQGDWKVKNDPININDPAKNRGAWQIDRNGRRGTLTFAEGLTLNGEPIVTGAQVSRNLRVTADLFAAREETIPDWARTGNELGSRGPG